MEPVIVTEFISVLKFQEKKKQWECPPNIRKYYAVAYQLDGRYEHFHDGRTYMMEKESVMLYTPQDGFEVICHDFGPCIAVHFTTAQPLDIPFTILDGSAIPQIKADFMRLYKAYNRRDEYSWYDCTAALYTILGKIRRANDSGKNYIQHRKYENIIRARDYLAENYNDPALSLDTAAAIAKVSPRRFGELFRRLYHVTPWQYITSLRISAAEELLRMKNYTVAEIAEAVGYAGASYFCRVFTHEVGVPPSRFTEREI